MKYKGFLFLLLLLILISCSNDAYTDKILRVKLITEESRELNYNIQQALPSTMDYKAEYLGNSNSGHHYGHTNGAFKRYSKEEGILLSQGKWRIYCRWYEEVEDPDTGEKKLNVVAKGDTKDVWVNLNTSSLQVYLDEDPILTDWTLSYSITSKTVANPYVYAELYSFSSKEIGVSPISIFSNTKGAEEDPYLSSTSDSTKENTTIYTLNNGVPLTTGRYILKIFVKESSSSTDILFTDVLGFVIRNGHRHTITGSTTAEKGSSGKNEYIHWEDNPSTPIKNTVEVGGVTSDNKKREELNSQTIKNETTYIVYESETGSKELNLGHSGNNTSNRIITPVAEEGKTNNFAIDMNGTDVGLSTSYGENTTIVQLNKNVTMNLFNSKENTTTEWGESNHKNFLDISRVDANVKVNGGAINLIGNGNTQNITAGSLVFTGPSKADSYTTWQKKQGAINLEGNGGKIVVDGDVTIKGLMGISSIQTKSNSSSLTSDPLAIDIKMLNGSNIQAETSAKFFGEETAYGIYLNCGGKGGTINIVLNGRSSISSSGSGSTDESAIKIENFTGMLNIIINDSTLSSQVGNCISLVNCTGTNSITLNNATLNGKTALNISGNTKVTVTKDGGEPKTYDESANAL